MEEYPIQSKAAHTILRNLMDHDLLSSDPYTVAIERGERQPIYPCGRGFPGGPISIDQLEWANKEGMFWFLGQIKILWIELDKNKKQGKNISAITKLLKKIAEDAGFSLRFERYKETN